MRAPVPLLLRDVGEKRDGLDGFAQTHLIGEDAVDALVIKIVKPTKSLELIILKLPLEARRSLHHLIHLLLRDIRETH